MEWLNNLNIPTWLSVTSVITSVVAILTLPYQLRKKKNENIRDVLTTDEVLIEAYNRMKLNYAAMLLTIEKLELEIHELRRNNNKLVEEVEDTIEDANEWTDNVVDLLREDINKNKNEQTDTD